MADTVVFQTNAATPPDGTVVSTEEVTTLNGSAVTAQQVQRILLALRTGDGVVIDLPGDAANGLKVQSSSLSLPSGAATAANQATEIASLASIDGKITTVNTGAVVVSSSALPSGAATAANQTTVIGHLDGVEALLGTIDADTGALAGAVAGTEVQVDVVGALPAGTNNIGDVDIASIAAGDNNIGNVDIASALPAGTNAIGTVDLVATGTIQRAVISASSSGDNTIVAALASNKTKVLGLVLIAAGDVDVRFESGAGGTALTGVMSLAVDGNGFVLPMAHKGYHWFETAANTLLNLELSAAVQVSGVIVYYQEA